MPICFSPFHRTVTISLLILLITFSSRAQYRAALKAHAFRVIDGLYTISFEQAFNKHFSAELSLQGGYYINVRPNRLEDYEVTGIGAIGSVRYYPFTKKLVAPRGFFGYTALRYGDYTETFLYTASGEQYRVGGNLINAGLGLGYKFVYRRLGLEAFVGWGIGQLKSDDDEYRRNIPQFHRRSIEEQEHFPQLDVAVCYMFNSFHSR